MNRQDVEFYLDANKIQYRAESGGKELRITCPFCHHPKNKCYINSYTGEFYCFHCGCAGAFSTLISELAIPAEAGDIAFIEKREVPTEYELPFVNPALLLEQHERLLEYIKTIPEIAEYLHVKRGFSLDTIKKFQLGWDSKNITIPVFTASGDCAYVKRKSDPTSPSTLAKNLMTPRGAHKRLFNEKALTVHTKLAAQRVIICEGEWDAMLLTQMGYQAVTSTAGATSFDASWIEPFLRFDKIYLVFDNDRNQTGQKGAKKTAELFLKRGIHVFIVNLPAPTILEEKVDISDFFVKRKKEKADFTALLQDAVEYTGKPLSSDQYSFIRWDQLVEMEFPKDQWIVDHLIPIESICCLAGLPGTMKSYFTNYLATCILQNKKVLGIFDTHRVPILFIDKENRLSRIKERFGKLGTPGSIADIHFMKGDFLIEKREALEQLETYVIAKHIKLVVIDTLSQIHTLMENDASEMNKVFHALYRIRQAGATVLLIHHFNKRGSGIYQTKDIRELLRGSGNILAQLDMYFALQLVEGGLLRFDVGKSRDEKPLRPFLIDPDFGETYTDFHFIKELEDEDVEKMRSVLMRDEVLLILKKKIRQTREEFIAYFGESKRATFDNTIKELKKLDKVKTIRNGNDHFYELADPQIDLEQIIADG